MLGPGHLQTSARLQGTQPQLGGGQVLPCDSTQGLPRPWKCMPQLAGVPLHSAGLGSALMDDCKQKGQREYMQTLPSRGAGRACLQIQLAKGPGQHLGACAKAAGCAARLTLATQCPHEPGNRAGARWLQVCWVGREGADSQWERHRGVAPHVDDPWGSWEAHVTAHCLLPSALSKGRRVKASQAPSPHNQP